MTDPDPPDDSASWDDSVSWDDSASWDDSVSWDDSATRDGPDSGHRAPDWANRVAGLYGESEGVPELIRLWWDDVEDAYLVSYDASEWDVSTVIVFAVADIWNIPEVNLPPLSSVINPESLDVILHPDTDGHVADHHTDGWTVDDFDDETTVSFEFASSQIDAKPGYIRIVPKEPRRTTTDDERSNGSFQ